MDEVEERLMNVQEEGSERREMKTEEVKGKDSIS